MLLSREQRIGAAILLGTAFIAWMAVALWPSRQIAMSAPQTPKKRSWEQRKDSMRRVDSMRYAQWAKEREMRYDSFRLADSMRRVEWKTMRQHQYDSFRLADSLWRDSVGWYNTPLHPKKDTVLDLNRCDTAELQLIRGIGRYTAEQIVRYRGQLGGFYSLAQLTDEPFEHLRLDTLAHRFTLNPADVTTIPVNTSSAQRLSTHPYLRYPQAKAIYTLRRKRFRLRSADDLRSLPELTPQDIERIAPYLSFE